MTRDTPLSRAFAAALDRAQAVGGPDAEQAVTNDRQSRGAMLLGTGIDPDELQKYTAALADAYFALFRGRFLELTETPGVPMGERSHRAFTEALRGAITQGVLVGHFVTRAESPAAPLGWQRLELGDDDPADASGDARVALTGAQRAELRHDHVQIVFDLEADHLERLAPTLETFGLHTIARRVRAASVELREALESEQ